MAENPTLDYYKLKVFLYKYTPTFSKVTDSARFKSNQAGGDSQSLTSSPISEFVRTEDGKVIAGTNPKITGAKGIQDQSRLAKIDRYTVELDEKKYFRKFDITEFVSNYTFAQDMNENTFSWSMVLHNAVIPFSQLNDRIKVEGPRIDAAALENLAEYEAQARDAFDTTFIREAKELRGNVETGKTQDSMSVRAGVISRQSVIASRNGIRLEDLIQPYDVVSVFLYRDTVPVEDLTGRKTKAVSFDGPVVFAVDSSSISKLTAADLRTETILLSPKYVKTIDETTGAEGFKISDQTLFSNEFNGFIMAKATASTVDAVDTLTITGNGITRLFGATRKLLKSSALQTSLYDIGEIDNPMALTPYQSVYTGRKVHEIFLDLFNSVYKIKPDSVKQVIRRTAIVNGRETVITDESSTAANSAPRTDVVSVPNSSFYDISAISVANSLHTNLFTIPPFLLSLVMKRHGYKYREPKTGQLQTLVDSVNAARRNTTILVSSSSVGPNGQQVSGGEVKTGSQQLLDQNAVDKSLDTNSSAQTKRGVRSPLFLSEELDVLRPYFRFVEDVLKFFNPELKTPFEIIDEVKAKTFLEFFERPDGTIVVRPPEYNDTTEMIRSSTVDIIGTSYAESVLNLVTRQNVSYSVDLIQEISPLKMFAYTNGKLFLQYGFIEASADANPNAKNEKVKNTALTQRKDHGLIRYAEYLLRLSNASLKTGSLVCGYDQRLQIGKTFFDEKNNKFGYILGVSKTINTGAAATVTITLGYVRDAYLFGDVLQFEPLERLVDIAQEFTSLPVDKNVSDPTPNNALTPIG
jgi:hypothetical protein